MNRFVHEQCKAPLCGLFFQPVARLPWRVAGYCCREHTPEYAEEQRAKAQKKLDRQVSVKASDEPPAND